MGGIGVPVCTGVRIDDLVNKINLQGASCSLKAY